MCPQIVQQGSTAFVLTPYDPGFVAELKLCVPASSRKWNPETKAWTVESRYIPDVKRLMLKAFGQADVLNQETFTQSKAQRYDRYLIEYVARVKDDGYALCWAKDGFTVRVSEKVLREFFELGMPVEVETKSVPSDYYQVLGIKVSATPDEVKTAWRRGVMTWHPDRCHEPDAQDWFQAVQEAYQVLSNQTLRPKYDAGRKLDQLAHKEERHQKKVMDTYGYTPPVRCGLLTFEGVQGVYLEITKILKWDDDTQERYGLKLIRVARPKSQHLKRVYGMSKAEEFFLTSWEVL